MSLESSPTSRDDFIDGFYRSAVIQMSTYGGADEQQDGSVAVGVPVEETDEAVPYQVSQIKRQRTAKQQL